MVNVVVIAFLIDIVASLSSQLGLLMQKLAQLHQEKKNGVLVGDSSPGPQANMTSKDDDFGKVLNERKRDKDETSKTYCSWRFALGIFFLALGTIIHIMVLPFLDLTLIAVNATVGIIFSVLLSIVVIGEQLVPKYDISGLIFISLGSTGIVLCANKVEQEFTAGQVSEMMHSAPAVILVITGTALFAINQIIMCQFTSRLRRFEEDVENYVKGQEVQIPGFEGLVADNASRLLHRQQQSILPERERINTTQSDELKEKEPLMIPESEFVERPLRTLVDTINACPPDVLKTMSPKSENLKKRIKMPMILFLLCTAIMSGISMVMMKMIGELVSSDSHKEHWFLLTIMAILLSTSGLLQLHVLNMAMKFYDQLEVVPVYQTSLMIMWIGTGLIVLDEKAFYSGLQLFAVFGSVLLCCIGIKLLLMKTKMLQIEAARERADSLTSIAMSTNRSQRQRSTFISDV